MRIVRFDRLGEFPLFNPDTEYPSPAAVRDLIDRVNAADGLLIASPEYAHGVTGVMKNALDWIGMRGRRVKPVAVLNAAARRMRTRRCGDAVGDVGEHRRARVDHAADPRSQLDAAGIARIRSRRRAAEALHAPRAAIQEAEPGR